MVWPTGFGRKLPRTDWEGDDFTPGAGGKYVTCMDTASGRMVAWATNSRIDRDGKVYRAAIRPPDPNGITLAQAQQAVHSVTNLTMIAANMTLAQKLTWLRKGNGLVVPGVYSTIPSAYRYQTFADFNHAIFFAFIARNGISVRKYDPLHRNIYTYGEAVPLAAVRAFLNSLPDWQVGYVPLQAL